MASGFPIGMGGSGCTYGAIAGGIMVLGLFLVRDQAKDSLKLLIDIEINLLHLLSKISCKCHVIAKF